MAMRCDNRSLSSGKTRGIFDEKSMGNHGKSWKITMFDGKTMENHGKNDGKIYPVVKGGSDQRSKLGVSDYSKYSLFNGEPVGATSSFSTT